MSAILICQRQPGPHGSGPADRWLRVRTPKTREAALAVVTPCCEQDGCLGAHILTWYVGRIPHSVQSPVPVPTLADELAVLGYHGTPGVESWPTPAEFNEDLDRPATVSPLLAKTEHAALLGVPVGPEQPPTSTLAAETAVACVVAHTAPVYAGYGPMLDSKWSRYPPFPIRLPRLCGNPGCGEPHLARNRCRKHYHQLKRPPAPTALERFFAKIEKSEDGCWRWIGQLGPHGYGRFYFHGKWMSASQWIYAETVGPVPPRHRLARVPGCSSTRCVNPDHWHPQTPKQIMRAMVKTRRKRRWHAAPPPDRPAPTPTSVATRYAELPPWHWKRRWTQRPAS